MCSPPTRSMNWSSRRSNRLCALTFFMGAARVMTRDNSSSTSERWKTDPSTTGTLPVNVKCLFEGEEEVGSPHLTSFIERNQRALAAKLAVISDTQHAWSESPCVDLLAARPVGSGNRSPRTKALFHPGTRRAAVITHCRRSARSLRSFMTITDALPFRGFTTGCGA